MAATTGSARAAFVPRAVDGDERVKPLELFFDLVFVFAITQVTGMLSEDPTWAGLARGLLVLGVLWWAWVAYAWLTNTVDPEEGFVRLAMFAAMAGDARRLARRAGGLRRRGPAVRSRLLPGPRVDTPPSASAAGSPSTSSGTCSSA